MVVFSLTHHSLISFTTTSRISQWTAFRISQPRIVVTVVQTGKLPCNPFLLSSTNGFPGPSLPLHSTGFHPVGMLFGHRVRRRRLLDIPLLTFLVHRILRFVHGRRWRLQLRSSNALSGVIMGLLLATVKHKGKFACSFPHITDLFGSQNCNTIDGRRRRFRFPQATLSIA